ncbi:hypothetical protein [Streptacidiphilus sp. EB129]|uniref:hypothetical protein n=1 Tax=Streptacidiphilus sp. EB129 TaxID=3156262 RepID=UPI003517FD63
MSTPMDRGGLGPQVPSSDPTPHTGASAALASAAYRDSPLAALAALHEGSAGKRPKIKLFAPTLGEAFCRAVVARTLGRGRKPIVPSYGTDARLVVEHCVEAEALRHQRDRKLTAVSFVAGFLFLPGALLWLLAFETERRANAAEGRSWLRGIALVVMGLITAFLEWRPYASGYAGLYIRVMMLAPLVGWYVADRICKSSAEVMRSRWSALLEGSAIGPTIPEAVPIGPADARAELLRTQLEFLGAEQDSNIAHYAGTKGILGMGKRWGSWQLAEQLDPREGVDAIRRFHPFDVIRKIEEHLNQLSRSTLATGGIPRPRVGHWAVTEIGEGAGEIARPSGEVMEGMRLAGDSSYPQTRMSGPALAALANKQQFGDGPRHYLGTQFVLWQGQLVLTMLVTVTVLHDTLRIEVTGHALGPLPPLFTAKPAMEEYSVPKPGKFWEEQTKHRPVVSSQEVVRLAVRAPFTWPWGTTLLDWLGGTYKLPEPFGLRHVWADRPWNRRFMADDAIRIATPVLRAVHQAMIEVLKEHDVNLDRFQNRSLLLGMEVQGARPSNADVYDAG